jgi:hypothetical protein
MVYRLMQTKATPSHAGCLHHHESEARGSKRVPAEAFQHLKFTVKPD